MTRHELRCSNINKTLITITEEMPEELKLARAGIIIDKMNDKKGIDVINENEEVKYNFRPYEKDQSFFVVVSGENFIKESHPAAVLSAVIEKLDLKILYSKYSKVGNPAYHPKMMLKILFYAYYDGIMSARTIWDVVIHRYDFIYLSGGDVPDFRTINSFRLKNLDILPVLFAQIVLLCKELDMIDFKHLAIDGEKIQANASYRNSKDLKGIEKEYDKIKEGIRKLLEKEINEYFTKEIKDKRVNTLTKKIEKLEEYKNILENMEDKTKRINIVDSDSAVMKHKDGQSLPGYNHQSARDGKLGVVTAARTTQNGDIPADLIPIVDQSIDNTLNRHENIIADCGFSSYEVLEELEKREEEFYIPDKRFEASKKDEEDKNKYSQEDFKRNENNEIICPNGLRMKEKQIINNDEENTIVVYEGTGCDNCPKKNKCTKGEKRTINIDSRIELRDKMREKLKTDKGREIYIKRQGLIEPMHGDDQKNKGWIQHHLRHYHKAKGEFLLMKIAVNLGLIIKHRASNVLALSH